ncbi:MAG TPA: heat-shock protein HspR [Actinobacteria bacterium]|jgi:MerR family transcriptional regulator, heat shock protein HspR|nr:heat-shock protein HspR [Actinomycetota bacterium]
MTSPSGARLPERTGYSVTDDAPLYAISVAAQLAGLHPQTLRQYDRLGLVTPTRVGGRNRLYSANDVARLCEIADLSSQGLSLEGIRRILDLQEEVRLLRARLEEFHREKSATSLVVWRPHRTR